VFCDVDNSAVRISNEESAQAPVFARERVDDFGTGGACAFVHSIDVDRHYGHLARDGREHAIRLLDTYRDAEAIDVHAVDARWTLNEDSDASADNGKGG
jgi:hypothetical protein